MSFSCLDCNRDFKTSQGLESHCDAKDHDGVWECCEREFDSWHAWDQHTTYAYAHRESECCGRTFLSGGALEQHMANAASHRTCYKCSYIFDSVERYNRHTCRQPRKAVNMDLNSLFKSPRAYAQRIGSEVHRTTVPTLEYNSTSRAGLGVDVDASFASYFSTLNLAPGVPIQTDPVQTASAVEPGPPLNARERAAAL